MRITYNKAKQLAENIDGAELATYVNGNVVIRLNAINLHGDDELLEALTLYNKLAVTMAEAKQLAKELVNFEVQNSELKGSNSYSNYAISSHGIMLRLYNKDEGVWHSHEPNAMLDSYEYEQLDKTQRNSVRRHIALVNEWFGA